MDLPEAMFDSGMSTDSAQSKCSLRVDQPSLRGSGIVILRESTREREGEFNLRLRRLTASEWEFIDIRMPRFMVKAIWPDYVPPADIRESVDETAYSPPYMELMDAAITHFQLSDVHQEKKEALVEWFRGKRVDGAQISGNLAAAMATLVRLPSAQKGGAKRSWSG